MLQRPSGLVNPRGWCTCGAVGAIGITRGLWAKRPARGAHADLEIVCVDHPSNALVGEHLQCGFHPLALGLELRENQAARKVAVANQLAILILQARGSLPERPAEETTESFLNCVNVISV